MAELTGIELIGITPEEAQKLSALRKARGRRDARICVCGHGANAHVAVDGETSIDEPGTVTTCQVGRVPCMCQEWKWVLTMEDIRSFIQKTEGPGHQHALGKALWSSLTRGYEPTWREGIACFWCKREPSECGPLVPIAYNERGGEAMRPTPRNMMMCSDCREAIRLQAAGGA